MDKTITIITPSYNSGNYIKYTLNSVANQKISSLEHLVIDGKSTDDTINILLKMENNLPYWKSETDSGQSEAINKGIKLAKGKIINWLNADDYYEPNALSIVYRHFNNLNVRVLAGKSRLFDENGTIKYSNGTDIYPGNLAKTIGWARIDQPETFFRKEAWDMVGLLNEQLHYTMDREWWMRYLYIYGLEGIKQIEDVLVNFRIHPDSKTSIHSKKFQIEHDSLFYLLALKASNHSIPKTIESECEINKTITSDISDWENQKLIDETLNYYCLKRADEFYFQGLRNKARAFLKVVVPSMLAVEDRKLFNTLAIRIKVPSQIINILRKK